MSYSAQITIFVLAAWCVPPATAMAITDSGIAARGAAGIRGVAVRPYAQAVVSWESMRRTHVDVEMSAAAEVDMPLHAGDSEAAEPVSADERFAEGFGGVVAAPTLGLRFQAAIRTDTIDEMWPEGIRPPDTMGAVGPDHFVEVINGNVSIFDKATGYRLSSVPLLSFFAEVHTRDIPYDPRVLFDHHSGRWVAMAADCRCDFNSIVFGISASEDPTGSWFLVGFESGGFADYPTLGVDQHGIYIGSDVVEKVWALEKAPLLQVPPSVGIITEWNVSVVGALHPAHTYGESVPQYFVQAETGTSLRILRLSGPITAPVLVDLGLVSIPFYTSPPNAPALGSTVALSVGNGAGPRLMMAVYRDGSLWTCHTVSQSGRCACRWYEIDPAAMTLLQSGTVADPSLHYFYPSIMVNAGGEAAIGFSGSNADQYIATYFTGRSPGDPPGLMANPLLLKAGESSYTVLDTVGRNRWGDYSYTTLDPVDQSTFWTLQEYATATPNVWGTWVGQLSFAGFDCNANGQQDAADLAGKVSEDCDANGVPDECQPDCNGNDIADTCDLLGGGSKDQDSNGVPDECECATDLNGDGGTDASDLAILLGAWGPAPSQAADINGDSQVDAADLALLLGAWGPCL